MMGYGELHLPEVPAGRNVVTGRFAKGHIPFNKGKSWNEWLSKRSQKKSRKGWMNVVTHRPTRRPDNSGRLRKQVIAVFDDGSWCVLPYIGAAGKWVGGCRENVRRCCYTNRVRHVNKKTGRVNTDHKYMGVRFYYEDDPIWITKIKT